jgi:hypothetical protein
MKAVDRSTVVKNLTHCGAVAVYMEYIYWTEM